MQEDTPCICWRPSQSIRFHDCHCKIAEAVLLVALAGGLWCQPAYWYKIITAIFSEMATKKVHAAITANGFRNKDRYTR